MEIMGVNIGGTFSSMTTTAWYIFIAIACLGILVGVLIFVWIQLQYKYRCYILEELSDGGTRIYEDKGRIKKRNDGTKIFKLKYFKDTVLPVPPLKSMMVGRKGNKSVFLKKFNINEFDFIPMGIYLRSLDIDIVPFPEGRKNWISTELKRSSQRHGTWWDRFGPAIMQISVMFLALVMIIIIFKMAQNIGGDLQGIAAVLENALTEFSKTCGGGAANAAVPPANPPAW